MADEPRITDHDPVLAAARADASREGARFVHMTVGQLWRMIHRGPSLSAPEQGEFGATLQAK
jgi:hypothetical protein